IGTSTHAVGATPRSCAVARIASGQALELDCFFGTARRFLEFNFEVVAQIITAPAARARPSASGAEEITKNVGVDLFETLAEIKSAEAPGPLWTLKYSMPKTVVLGALLRIREDLVRLVYFLESLFGLFIARITVRMKLNGQTPIGFFNFLLTGGPTDA